MRVAWLFPGQGVELRSHHLEVATSPHARALLATAAAIFGRDPMELVTRRARELDQTRVLQPLVVAISLAVTRELEAAGAKPDLVAGHSLGELSAWSAAGCISAGDAIRLAGLRGELMGREAARHPGAMLALTDATPEIAAAALAAGAPHGRIVLAAHNSETEITLSGDTAAIDAVARSFPSARLRVEGAWHSPAMQGAVEELRRALLEIPRRPPGVTLLSNRTGEPTADPAPDLAEQLIRPVEWLRTMQTLVHQRVTHVVTVGPGRTLRALLRSSPARNLVILGTETPADTLTTLETLTS